MHMHARVPLLSSALPAVALSSDNVNVAFFPSVAFLTVTMVLDFDSTTSLVQFFNDRLRNFGV